MKDHRFNARLSSIENKRLKNLSSKLDCSDIETIRKALLVLEKLIEINKSSPNTPIKQILII